MDGVVQCFNGTCYSPYVLTIHFGYYKKNYHIAVFLDQESLHVQLGILEAKMESSLRKQEADLRSEAEREVCDFCI